MVLGQHDGVPANGKLPTTTWQVDEIVTDRHQFDFPTAQKGEYRLIVGLYDPLTGGRLPITDSAGVPVGDFLPLHTFKIPRVVSKNAKLSRYSQAFYSTNYF